MNSNHCTRLITLFLGLTALTNIGWAENPKATDAPLPPAKVAAARSDSAAIQWSTLKDFTYDQRAQFFAGFKQMEAVVDDQIKALTAKRAAMTGAANTQDWDFAMQEMGNARSHLKSTGEVLTNATPETWNQEKDRVGQAWVRTQEAFAKVKSSTTS